MRIRWIVAFLVALAVGLGGWMAFRMMMPKLPAMVKPIAEGSELWRIMKPAYAAAEAGDHKRAVELWTQALRIEPGPNVISNRLHAERGSAYNFLDMPKEAYADYDAALRDINPKFITRDQGLWFMGRGYAALNLKQYQHAKDDLDIVINLVPNASNALAWRGAAYQGLGDREHAVADYKAALALNPNNVRARDELKVLEPR